MTERVSFWFRSTVTLLVVSGIVAWSIWRESKRELAMPERSEPLATRSGCVPDEPEDSRSGPVSLTDVTTELGIDFQHVVGPLGTYFMPESIGAGGAIFDSNGDGLLDIYFINCGRSPNAVGDFLDGTRTENRLFVQQLDGTFRDLTEQSGLGDRGYGAGCAVGDIDNDGDLDVYVTNYGPDRLFTNDGQGTFTDITEASGIRNDGWGTCASFFDYDRDGLLDLCVVNYTADEKYHHSISCGFERGLVSYCGPHKFQPTIDRVFHNEGAPGEESPGHVQFRDVTDDLGLNEADSYGFGLICADFNNDQWPDIFVANDGAANRLWINQQGERFVEEAAARGVAYNGDGIAEAGMGVAFGDLNIDGSPDLFVSHLSKETSTLYLSSESGDFQDRTAAMGLADPTRRRTGWGTALVDLNHDGHLDLPNVNGLVIPCHSRFPFHGEDAFQERVDDIDDAVAFWRDYADLNVLLMGTEAGRFTDQVDGRDFTSAIASGRGLIYGDLDRDGDLDLVVTNCGGPAKVYRNDFSKAGHWLLVRAYDADKKRDAIGATVTIHSGNQVKHGFVIPGSSYLASNDMRVHFGLGEIDQIDQLIIQWPDGPLDATKEAFEVSGVDQEIQVRRGSGKILKERHD